MGNEKYRKIIDEQSNVYDKERVRDYFLQTSSLFKRIIRKGMSVIEIGSGTGLYVIDLVKNGRYAVGIDYSRKMLEIAERNAAGEHLRSKFIFADAEKSIPNTLYNTLMKEIGDMKKRKDMRKRRDMKEINETRERKEGFDFALLIGNWEYFEQPVKVLENISRVLKEDGRIVISTLNIFSWPLITFLELTGLKRLRPAFWHFNSIPSRLKGYAANAGFYVEKSFFNYYFLDKVYILRRKE